MVQKLKCLHFYKIYISKLGKGNFYFPENLNDGLIIMIYLSLIVYI